jgi:hypothetical protein
MANKVYLTKQAEKAAKKLPRDVFSALFLLKLEIAHNGPVRGNWPNYSKLSAKTVHHCHLKKGNPTYVAIWKEVKKGEIWFVYVGTHEGAKYDLYK